MKKLFVLAVILLGLTVCSNAFAADSARNVGDTGYLDGAQAIADVGTANCARVDTNGNLGTTSTQAMTLVRKESSKLLSGGALAYTTNFAAKTRVKQILIHSSAAITQTVTFSLDSKTNATYDTTLASEDLVAESNYTYIPADLVLESGDELLISCTNTSTPAITVYVTVLGETIS